MSLFNSFFKRQQQVFLYKRGFFLLFFLVLFSPQVSYAILYNPGETLEPACSPDEDDCGVVPQLTAGANDSITSLSGLTTALSAEQGGTGIASYNAGDFLFASDASTLSALNIGAEGDILQVVGGLPVWGDDLSVSGNFNTPKGSDYPTTGSQNDVDFGAGSLFRYTGNGTATFTGIAGGTNGKQIRIMNVSSFNVTLSNQSAASVAANRIITTSGGNLTLPPDVSVGLQYDSGASRWRVVVLPATSGTINSFAFVQNGSAFGSTGVLGTTDPFGLNFITSGNTRFSLASGSATLTGSGATSITTNNTLSLSSADGSALNITAGTTGVLTLDTGTTGAINFGAGLSAKTLTIGNTVGATAVNIKSGSGGISLTGLVTLGNASSTALSILQTLSIGTIVTSTIVGDNGVSTLHSDLVVTGSTTLQNVVAQNVTSSANFYSAHISGDVQQGTLARVGNSTFSTLQDLQNVFHSAGYTSGGAITEGDPGTINVASGTGLLRATNSALATIFYADWSSSSTIPIPVDSIRYIGVEYNNGNPSVTSRTTANWNYKTDFPLGVVTNENGTLHIGFDVQGVGDHAANMIQREYETMPLSRDERDGGLMIMESGDNLRHIMLTSGALWDRLTRYTISEIDTSVDGSFDLYKGVTKEASNQTQWDNLHYNNAGVLTVIDASKYAAMWFYIETDGNLVAMYGTGQYANLAAATAEEPPITIPNRLVTHGKLVGRIIFQKSATVAAQADSAFNMSQFSTAALTHLSNLSDLDFASSGLIGFVGTDGVEGGQAIIGGTQAVDGLTFQSTSANGATDFIKFLVGNNGGIEAARFLSNGNFGIATSSPYAKLSVNGRAVASNFVADAAAETSTFSGPVALSNILNVSGLSTLVNLTATGVTSLQGLTALNSNFTNVSSTNFSASGYSDVGTVIGGTWNGSAVGSLFGGTGQTSWTKGDILYASDVNVLSKLAVGGEGTVLTVGGTGVPTWAAAGAGLGGASQWASSTNNLALYTSVPTTVVLVGASATTSRTSIFEVTGDSVYSGLVNVSGLTTLNGGVSTTLASISQSLYVGGNATTTNNGAFSTNGAILAAAAGTGLSVINDVSVGGIAMIANLLTTGSTTLQNLFATNVTSTNATTTNLHATNFSVDNFSSTNLSTGGTLTVSNQTSLGNASSTGNVSIAGSLWMSGFATSTNGILNVENRYQLDGVDVLTSNTLGSGITNSSLTSLGTLGSLTVSGQTTMGSVSSTGNVSVSGALWINGFTTTTSGVVNTNSKYKIAGVDVLTVNTLGSGITNSSLTSLGTLGALTVSGQSSFSTVSTTGGLTVGGSLFISDNATISPNGNFVTNGTITSGIINGQTISAVANFTGSLTTAGLLTASNGLTLTAGALNLPVSSVADTALSANVPLLNRLDQTFAGANTFSGLTTVGNASSTQVSVSENFFASGNFVTPNGDDYPTTGVQNDVDLGVGSVFRYTGAGDATFTGIAGGTDGRQIRIVNASSVNFTLNHQDVASVDTNRILIGSGLPITITQNGSITLLYDASISRWRLVQIPASAAIIGAFAFLQNGNAYGATAVLGTTDANGLNFITSGNTRFSVATGASTLTGTGATTLNTDNILSLASGGGFALNVIASTTGALNLDSGTTGAVNVGTSANAKIITLGNGTGATSLVLNAGTGNIDIGANAVARTINVGTGAAVVETINVGGTGANVIGIANTQTAGSLSLGAAMTGGTISIGGTGLQTGNFDLAPGTGAQTITFANGSGIKTLSIAGGISGNTISLGNGANSAAQVINIGAGASAANSTVNILSGVATAGTQTLNLGTGASAKTINIGNTTGATALNLQSGSGNINLQVAGTATIGNVQVGAGGAGSATPDLLVADIKSTANDPAGTNGAIYYNANANKFRCFENGAWTNCVTPPGSDIQHAASYDTNEALTNVPTGGGQTTLGTVSVTPSSATGDIYVTGWADVLSGNNTDQPLQVVIETTNNCTGAVVGNATVTYTITAASGSARGTIRVSGIAVDAGASAHPYSLCAAVTSGGGDSDVMNWGIEAMVIDTGADVAEIYTTNDSTLEAGDIVSIDPTLKTGVKKSESIFDNTVIGIVSTRPGSLIGGVDQEGVKAIPIALAGRVPVKVTDENGPISEGDYLSPSSLPGVAMKSNGSGSVIGQAISSYTGEGTGVVLAFVKNFHLGESAILLGDVFPRTSTSSENGLSELIETIQTEVAPDPIYIITQKITDGKQFLTNFVAARVTAIRGYFDEIFTNKTHQKTLCIGDMNNETCITKSQLDGLLSGQNIAPAQNLPASENTVSVESSTPVISEPVVHENASEPSVQEVPVEQESSGELIPDGVVDASPIIEESIPEAPPEIALPEPVAEQVPEVVLE